MTWILLAAFPYLIRTAFPPSAFPHYEPAMLCYIKTITCYIILLPQILSRYTFLPWRRHTGGSGNAKFSLTHPSLPYFCSRGNFLLPYHMLATPTTAIQHTNHDWSYYMMTWHILNMADQSLHFAPVVWYPHMVPVTWYSHHGHVITLLQSHSTPPMVTWYSPSWRHQIQISRHVVLVHVMAKLYGLKVHIKMTSMGHQTVSNSFNR